LVSVLWTRMPRKILRSALLGLVAACLLHSQIGAGRIVGTITDSGGAVIPNAVIKIVDEKTGEERNVIADTSGYYVAPNLKPSTYKVTAQATNLGPSEFAGIPLSVGQERVLNITVRPATVTTEVNVSGGDLTTIDVSSAEIGANINSREVAQLPLNGR